MIDDQHALVSICVDNDQIIKSMRGDVAEKGEVAFPPLQPFNSVCVAIIEIKVDKNDIPKNIDNKHVDELLSTERIISAGKYSENGLDQDSHNSIMRDLLLMLDSEIITYNGSSPRTIKKPITEPTNNH